MKKATRLLLPALLVPVLAGCDTEPVPAEADLLIAGGRVADGTGAPLRDADLLITGDRVVFVGGARGVRARDTVDATGLVVTPGFIDVHNHTDRVLGDPDRRLNEPFILQGVTHIVGGPDGGHSPVRIREFIASYERHGVGTNYSFYVGHNGIRLAVMGSDQQREPTAAELDAMRALVREGMELGAVGFSTGLMYEPGMYSTTAEVVALAREVAPYGGVYDSHDRDPVNDFIASTGEVIEVAERAGVPGRIAHFKTVGLQNAGLNADAIRMVNEARARGLDITSDQYPYDGAATSTLDRIVVVPRELATRPDFSLASSLRDPGTRAQLRDASEQGIAGGFAWLKAVGYGSLRITHSPDYPELVGRYISELAESRGQEPFDLVSELILGAGSPVGITLGAIEEADVRALMVQPWNMIASDGGYVPEGSTAGHPRATGTFPRVLGRYVREEGVLTVEDAIHKMTWLPARNLGFEDRGRLVPGAVADVVVFDPERIIDRSTWERPYLLSEGVVHVLVNGIFVLRDEAMTGEAPGRFVPRPERRLVSTLKLD